MSLMNNMTLPLPNPGDWVSVAGAAAILRCSVRTVTRRVREGRLKAYLPYGARDLPNNYILWRKDVADFGKALKLVRDAA